MDAGVPGASFARTSGTCADGEVVWSWRPDAGAKFLRSKLLRDDGGKKARSPAIRFTHLENRLEYRDLGHPRVSKHLYVGGSTTVDKLAFFLHVDHRSRDVCI